VHIGAEEKVRAAGLLDDLEKTWFVDGEIIGVPSIDLLLVDINDTDTDLQSGETDQYVRRETEKCAVGQISKNSTTQVFHDQFTPRDQRQVNNTIHIREQPYTG
jgi:hypothetical protein